MILTLTKAPTGATVVPGDTATALASILERETAVAFAAGIAQGRLEAAQAEAKALDSAASGFDALAAASREEVGATAVALAVEIARHLLRAEVDAGRYDLEAIVRDALEQSGTGRRNCTVHINPVDLERLKDVPFRAGTELEADVSVAVGDVQITTPDGLLVRDLDRAVETIGERILGDLS